MPDPETQELKIDQHRRREHERDSAEHATEENEALTHGRRAERAAYLEEKLEERARSEDRRGTTDS